jgi:putative CocE/NonD family hydrolase
MTASTAWEPDPEAYGVAVTTDIPVRMADGRVLRANTYVPTDPATGAPAEGPFPVILSETPYGKTASPPIDRRLISRGYIGVAVDVGGTGGSDGHSLLFSGQEAADSVQVIDWAAALPHSNGNVGMIGGSYLAIDQLFAAAAVGPDSPLKAIFPIAASVDPYRDLFVSGGLVNMESSLGLLAAYGVDRTITPLVERPNDLVDALRLVLEHGLQMLPFEGQVAVDAILDGPRRYDGDWWQQRTPENVLDRIVANQVAVFLVGGLYDVFQRGEPLLYSGLQNAAAGRPVFAPMLPGQQPSPDFQLLTGPWNHGNQGEGVDLLRIQLAWFDQWLKGRDTGILDTDQPLQVVEPGGATYRTSTYPLTEATVQHRDLGRATTWFTALSQPCGRSTQQWSAGIIPESACGDPPRSHESFPAEAVFTSAPEAEPLRLAGPVGVTVEATANTAETMWVVTVDDVAPDGTAEQLSSGGLLGSMRAVDTERSWPSPDGGYLIARHPLTEASQQAVTPGALTRYDIEVRPIFATVPAGHRLRVTIGTGDFPHLTPPPLQIPFMIGGRYDISNSWIDLSVAPVQ